MEINITTPALLFPAISLLLLAFTNRFLVLAQLIRELHAKKSENAGSFIAGQIKNLQIRLKLIRYMQVLGVISFLLCTVSMFFLFLKKIVTGEVFFGGALVALLISLTLSLWEVSISTKALSLELSDMGGKI